MTEEQINDVLNRFYNCVAESTLTSGYGLFWIAAMFHQSGKRSEIGIYSVKKSCRIIIKSNYAELTDDEKQDVEDFLTCKLKLVPGPRHRVSSTVANADGRLAHSSYSYQFSRSDWDAFRVRFHDASEKVQREN